MRVLCFDPKLSPNLVLLHSLCQLDVPNISKRRQKAGLSQLVTHSKISTARDKVILQKFNFFCTWLVPSRIWLTLMSLRNCSTG